MSDIHIDDFYRDTAKILVTLYNQFPRKITLYVEDISGADKPDEFGLHSPRHLACFHAMLWLAGADYLSFETLIRQEAIDQVVLSHRSFMLLNSSLSSPYLANSAPPHLPAVVAEQEFLIINRIRRELKEGSSYSLADLVRQVMGLSRQFG
jgi:hypothetical protein